MLEGCFALPDPCTPIVWRTTDAGAVWRPVGTGPIVALSFVDPLHGWAILAREGPRPGVPLSGLLATSDGGATWAKGTDPCHEIGTLVAVSFTDVEHGWVGCNGVAGAGQTPKAILATTDGGRTWSVRSEVEPPGGPTVGRIPMADGIAGLRMRADGVGIWWGGRGVATRTSDGGRTWIGMSPGEWDVRIPVAGWLSDDRRWLLLLWEADRQRQIVEATADAGRTWTLLGLVPVEGG